MATKASFIEFVADTAALGRHLTWRKMFGEYAIYYDERVVALACDDRLYLKPTDAGRALLERVVEGPPYPGAKPHFIIDAALDEPELLAELLRTTARALPPPKPKKKAKAKRAPKSR